MMKRNEDDTWETYKTIVKEQIGTRFSFGEGVYSRSCRNETWSRI